MPIDLGPIREFIEDEMMDKCVITRDPDETADDDYDEDTATYTQQGIQQIYSGKCMLSTQGWQPSNQVQGGAEVVVSAFRLLLPITSVKIELRDLVVITKSVNDVKMVGQSFVVDDRIDSTHAITQALLVSRTIRRIPL